MPTHVSHREDLFPAGTSVSVYTDRGHGPPTSGAPSGTAITGSPFTVAGDGSLTITGLETAGKYLLYASSPDRYLRIFVPGPPTFKDMDLDGIEDGDAIGYDAGTNKITSLGPVVSTTKARAPLTRARSNRVTAIGTSHFARGTSGDITLGYPNLVTAESIMGWAALQSGGDGLISYVTPAAVSESTTTTWITTQITNVLALDPAPGVCVIDGPFNDIPDSAAISEATTRTRIASLCDSLYDAGILPCLCTVLPRTGSSSDVYEKMTRINAWLTQYANDNGYPLADIYSAVVDTDGEYVAAYTTDNTHLNGTGAKVAGQVIADALGPFMPPAPYITRADNSNDTQNLIGTNSLFLSTVSSPDRPTGWGASGSPTSSVAADTDIAPVGHVMTLTRAGSNTIANKTITTLIPGHRYEVVFRIETDRVSGTGATEVNIYDDDSLLLLSLRQGAGSTNPDVVAGTFRCEFTPPATSASGVIDFRASTAAGTTIKFAEVTLIDMEDIG